MEYLRIVRRRWAVVVGATLLALAATWLTLPDRGAETSPPDQSATLYEAQHTLKLDNDEGRSGLPFEDLAVLAAGDAVRQRAVQEVNAELESTADVPTAALVPDEIQRLLTYSVTHRDPDVARITADAYGAALKSYAADRVRERRTELIAQAERRRDELQAQLLNTPNPSATDTSPRAELARAQRQALMNSYVSTLSELQSLTVTDAAQETGLFTLEPASAAAADSDVVSLGPPVDGLARFGYGGLLGLVLGLGLALAVDHLDPRIHTPEGVSAALGAPVLGTVPVALLSRRFTTSWTRPGSEFRRIARLLSHLPRWLLAAGGDTPVGRTQPERLPPADVTRLLVTSLGSGQDAAEVAARLAAATADDDRVVGLMNRSTGQEHARVLSHANGQSPEGAMALPWSPDSSRRPGIVLVEPRTNGDRGLEARTDVDILDVGCLDEAIEGLGLLSEVDAVLVVVPLGRVAADALSRARTTLANLDAPVVGVVLLDPSRISLPHRRRRTGTSVDTSPGGPRETVPGPPARQGTE